MSSTMLRPIRCLKQLLGYVTAIVIVSGIFYAISYNDLPRKETQTAEKTVSKTTQGAINLALDSTPQHKHQEVVKEDPEIEVVNVSGVKFKAREESELEPNSAIVLYWTTVFGQEDFGRGFGSAPFKSCEYKRCFATNNKTLLEKASAVMFHHGNLNRKTEYPATRSPNQTYVFYTQESPAANNYSSDLAAFNNYFNMTMSYRLDSDVIMPYMWVRRHEQPPEVTYDPRLYDKQVAVAWMVSHCETPSRRQRYVTELRRHIRVDVFGKCGEYACSYEPGNGKCMRLIENKYFFYLSFENSFCRDYVTEKLAEPLRYNVVPVVRGGANYSDTRLVPPNAVINAADFATPKQLAAFLRAVMRDPVRYAAYFEWKRNYLVGWADPAFCGLCKKLHTDETRKSYADIKQWWKTNSHCQNQTNLTF